MIEITEVRLTKTDNDDKQLAYGSITFENAFVVNGIRVIKNSNDEKFVAYPSRRNQNGEYKDICFPMTKELRDEITSKVLAKYDSM